MNIQMRKFLAAGACLMAAVLCVPTQPVYAAAAGVVADEQQTPLTTPIVQKENVGYDSVTVSWTQVPDAVSYELQQSRDKKNITSLTAVSADGAMSYTSGGLYTAKTYYFRVRATLLDGSVQTSKWLKTKTALAAPTLTTLQATPEGMVSIAWSPAEGASFYRVYRSLTKTGGYQIINTLTGTTYIDQIPLDTPYYYKIMPLRTNPDGKNVRGKCTTPQKVVAEQPRPQILSIENVQPSGLVVSWNYAERADGFAIYRSTQKKKGYTLVGETTNGSQWTDAAVEAGVKYYYKVSAGVMENGVMTYGKKSDCKSRWTTSPVPTDVQVSQDGVGEVVVKWTASKAAGYYRVYRTQGADGAETLVAEKNKKTQYVDKEIEAGATYSYRIEAVHGSLTSAKSEPVSIEIGTIKLNTRTLLLGPDVSAKLKASSELPGETTYQSGDPAIATVTPEGKVTGVVAGKTQIYVSVGMVTTSVTVTVTDCKLNGIDVSRWQQAIDWKTVKASGIKFAMLRLAYGTSKDIQFEKYYAGATEQKIPVGIYCYSLATSVSEGKKEAKALLELLDGKPLDYPIALDLEDNKQIKNMNKKQRTQLIIAYKNIVEEAGYQFVVYANLNWLNNYIDQSQLEKENVDIWIARYRGQSLGHGYTGGGNVTMWQYTSSGQVDGILDAYGRYINVDLDVCYGDY